MVTEDVRMPQQMSSLDTIAQGDCRIECFKAPYPVATGRSQL